VLRRPGKLISFSRRATRGTPLARRAIRRGRGPLCRVRCHTKTGNGSTAAREKIFVTIRIDSIFRFSGIEARGEGTKPSKFQVRRSVEGLEARREELEAGEGRTSQGLRSWPRHSVGRPTSGQDSVKGKRCTGQGVNREPKASHPFRDPTDGALVKSLATSSWIEAGVPIGPSQERTPQASLRQTPGKWRY
jgi:hypothetical protein